MANETYGWKPEENAQAGQSDINFHVATKKRNSAVVVLSVVCVTLLLLVGAAILFVSMQGVAVVPGSDGRLSIVIGKNNGNSPFDVAQPNTTNDQTTNAAVELNLQDPPQISTSPVDVDGPLSTREIAARVKPSVVGILVSNRFSAGHGSGIIMTENGYIITNHHVVSDAATIVVVLESGERHDGTVVGMDEQSDLAVVKIEVNNLPAATFGNSDALQVGDRAIAIGTPYDLSLMGTTTQGIISAINRDIVYDNRVITLLQTDATINPGNSGGPLVNEFGQVVGINSMKIGQNFEGLGFAIPMNTAKEIIEELITNGRITGKPALGISGQMLNAATAAANNVPMGLYVVDVYEISNAYNNLRPGDIVTQINGVEITDMPTFNKLKNAHKAGDSIELTVYRDINLYDDIPGTTLTISVTLIDEDLLLENTRD